MMKKVIEGSLSVAGIQHIIDELEKYSSDLENKCNALIERLGAEGLKNVSLRVASIDPFYRIDSNGADVNVEMDVDHTTGSAVATIRMYGGAETVIIEFGAGVHHNTGIGGSLHPNASEVKINGKAPTIGSFPEQTHADSPYGWYFTDHNGESQHTYGTPTFAPLYNGIEDVKHLVSSIAREIFANG